MKTRSIFISVSLALLASSFAYSDTSHNGETVEVQVPFDQDVNITDAKYDGVTAGLRVNQSVHAPLLCVVDVMDVASGDLSLPGKVKH